jgi:hypothetical protein
MRSFLVGKNSEITNTPAAYDVIHLARNKKQARHTVIESPGCLRGVQPVTRLLWLRTVCYGPAVPCLP